MACQVCIYIEKEMSNTLYKKWYNPKQKIEKIPRASLISFLVWLKSLHIWMCLNHRFLTYAEFSVFVNIFLHVWVFFWSTRKNSLKSLLFCWIYSIQCEYMHFFIFRTSYSFCEHCFTLKYSNTHLVPTQMCNKNKTRNTLITWCS